MQLSCLLLGIVFLPGRDWQKEQYSENGSKSDGGKAGVVLAGFLSGLTRFALSNRHGMFIPAVIAE